MTDGTMFASDIGMDNVEEINIVKNGGIPMPPEVPENFGGFKSQRPPLGNGDLLPVWEANSPEFNEWCASNVRPQKQKGYSIVTVTTDQGNLIGGQMYGLADIADQAGDAGNVGRIRHVSKIARAHVRTVRRRTNHRRWLEWYR